MIWADKTNHVYAYDTSTFEKIASYTCVSLDTTYWQWGELSGLMTVSDDGNTLFAATDGDVHVVNVADTTAIKPTLTLSTAQPTYGQAVTITATLPPEAGFLSGDFTFMAEGVSLGKVTMTDSGIVSLTTSKLATGAHSLTVAYSDCLNSWRHFTSDAVSLTVAQAQANVQLQLSSDALPSSTVSVVAHVAGQGSAYASGTVAFYDGDTYLDSVNLFSGYATYTSAQPLPLGVHSITAVYSGDSNYLTITSAPLAVDVYRNTSEVVWSAPPTTVANDEPFALKFAVHSSRLIAVTGTVSVYEGDALIGTATLDAGGDGTLTVPTPTTGTHLYTAVYSGSTDILGSASQVLEVTSKVIPPVSSVTSLVVNQVTAELDSTFHFVAIVAPVDYPSASGTVSFYDGATLLATINVDSNNRAAYSTDQLSVGTHGITAVYNGSLRVATSTSTSWQIVVTPLVRHNATMHLSLDDDAIAAGTYASFGVALDGVDGFVPTGTVSFYDGSKLLGASVVDPMGRADFGTSNLAAGTHTIKAVYSGSARFASTSATVKQTVYETYTVDLLVLFTGLESDQANYTTIAQQAIDQTNEVMANSDIGVTIHLAGVQWVDYTESGNYTRDITRLTTPGDHYLDDVFELRRKYHADLVSLFVSQPEYDTYSQTLGIASTLDSTSGDPTCAYSVVSVGDAANYVLAHELGHNFGARHETRIDSADRGFANGHGYEFKDEFGSYYHDVMAYGREDSTLIPYYSNPNIYYEGTRIGSSSANASAVIQRNAKYIAHYSDGFGGIREATEPVGVITVTSHTTITGWAYDANLGNKPVTVRVMIDGVMGQSFLANLNDASLDSTLGSTKHGFVYKIPANISVGEHNIELMVLDSPGTSWMSVATATVQVDVRPDLAVAVGSPADPLSTYIPGDTISVPITITNNGATTAVGTKANPIHVIVYLTTGADVGSMRIVVAAVSLPYSLAAGASRTIKVSVPLTIRLAAGSYFLGAEVDDDGKISEVNEDNNSVLGASVVNFAWQFGSIAGRKGNAVLTMNDQDGTKVSFTLSGPGTGTLTLGADGYDAQIMGSTLKSSLSVATQKSKTVGDDARFTLHNLTVGNYSDLNDRTSLYAFSARTTNITGNVDIGGALLNLLAADMLAGSAIRVDRLAQVGGSYAYGTEISITLGRVSDLSIESSLAIKSLSVVEWLNQTIADDVIRTNYIREIKVTGNSKLGIDGDFDAELQLSGAYKTPAYTLGTVSVAGMIDSVAWTVLGSVGSITAKTISTKADFQNGNIGSIRLTGKQLNHSLNITANSLAKLEVYGNLVFSSIILDQGVSKSRSALGSAYITGDVVDTVIRADGNVGTLVARSLTRSGIYMGVRNDLNGLAQNTGDFTSSNLAELPVLTKLSLTGTSPTADYVVFKSSFVVAGSITSVVFAKSSTEASENHVDAYGFATVGGTKYYAGPASHALYVNPLDSIVSNV